MRKYAVITLLLGLVVVLGLFAFGITTGHLDLDDWGYTLGCPFVRGGLTWSNLGRAFSELSYGAIWMPFTFASYMLDTSLWGTSWRAYHAVNVAVHLVNVVLVFALLRTLLSTLLPKENKTIPLACAFAAVLWAVHPLRAEAVTYVAARKEELWTLFALAGLLAFHSFLARRTLLRYGLVVACFLLALISKPTALCFPFLLLAMAYLEQGLDRKTAGIIAPLFVLSAATGILAIHSQACPSTGAAADVYVASLGWRVLNAAVSVGLYLWHTVWPLGIHADYRAVFGGWPVEGTLGLCVLAATLVALVIVHRQVSESARRLLVGAVLLFAFALGPTLGVFGYVNGDQAMADRYTYFPHVAVALAAAYGLARMGADRARRVAVGAAALILLEAGLALPVVVAYGDNFATWSRTLAKDPDHWRALRFVGNEYCARLNRMDEGVGMLRKSLRLRKSQQTADALAYILANRGAPGDFADVKRLGSAVAKNPKLDAGGMMLDALGIVALREGDWARSALFFGESLKAPRRNHSPDWSLLYLGLDLANLGKREEACSVLERLTASRVPQVARRARAVVTELKDDTNHGTLRHPYAF